MDMLVVFGSHAPLFSSDDGNVGQMTSRADHQYIIKLWRLINLKVLVRTYFYLRGFFLSDVLSLKELKQTNPNSELEQVPR